MTVQRFVDDHYLPYVKEQKRLSTYRGYLNMWTRHLKDRTEVPLRDFRTMDGEELLLSVLHEADVNRTTLAHIKSFLSGAFRYARRQGVLNTENPMRDVVIPKARPGNETHAYSLEDILRMLAVLPEPAATIVATAAFTGARRGEIRGMLWENYIGDAISVTQSVWRGHVDEPKTRKSKAPVPVIPELAKFLESHRQRSGKPKSGFMFRSPLGRPLDLAHVARWVIRPALKDSGVVWHGWHAFRRGLATNLHRLGVADKTIQAILRHSNISTTMNLYVKSVPEDATAAMRGLQQLCNQHATAMAAAARHVM
jgi:integrase